MSTTIRIKRSGNTNSPTTLASGELAYSWAAGAGGGKLFLGTGSEIIPGQAPNIDAIGGKYFMDMLDHNAGTLTASSAIIVDSNSKIDQLFVDNIVLNNNTISTTTGDLIFNPSGVIDVSGKRITNGAAPVSASDFVTLGYLSGSFTGILSIFGDTGSDSISLGTETLQFAGGIGTSTAVTANTVTINLTNTGITANTYGNANTSLSLTVNAQGRVTGISGTKIAIQASAVTDMVEAVEDIAGAMVTGSTQNGISVTYNDATGKINFDVSDPTITLSGDVSGSATMTNLGNVTITTTIQANSVALGTDTTGNYLADLVPGTGVFISGSASESWAPTISIGQNVIPSANVTFRNLTLSGSMQLDGNLVVSGNIVSISTQTLSIQDNLIFLNEPTTESIINVIGNGSSIVYTTSDKNTILSGMTVSISGVNPGAYNLSNQTVTSSNSSAFVINNSAVGSYVSGGTALGRNIANPDLGFVGGYDNGSFAYAGMFRDATDERFKVFKGYTPTPGAFIDTSNASFQLAEMQASTFYGALSGNATTATTLQTGRKISLSGDVVGNTTFSGSGDVTIVATIQPDSVVLGTDTTGNFAASIAVTASTGLTLTGAAGENIAYTLAGINANNTVKGVASFDVLNFSANSGSISLVSIDGGTY
jgi:hypothetical protein